MMLPSFDDAYAIAARAVPFSNGFEGDSWMAVWCERCAHYDYCPLIAVALVGRTPVQWTEVNRASLDNRYRCAEFHSKEEVR
jgi:hypothetical protein